MRDVELELDGAAYLPTWQLPAAFFNSDRDNPPACAMRTALSGRRSVSESQCKRPITEI
jgi:hypothetical protein